MHRLTSDRGAIAVLVALLFPVVFLGFGAIVLDFGSLYSEKRQLQNGADAGALAVARGYAVELDGVCAVDGKRPIAESYADANANDGPGNGSGAGEGSDVESLTCPAPNKVRVTSLTSSADGNVMRPILRQFFGAGDLTLRASAVAAWGAPASLTSSIPLTISKCEYDYYRTALGTAPPGPYPPYYQDGVIRFHDAKAADRESGCPTSSAGADLPGGFGWLLPDADPADGCLATTDAGGWVDDKTGAAVTGTGGQKTVCKNALAALRGKVLNLPIYDTTNGLSGANGEYHIVSYAAFVLTGYSFPGERTTSLFSNTHYCTPSEGCIYGFFTTDATPGTGTVGSGPSMGVTVIQLTE